MADHKFDIVIIGGGIIGLTLALELSKKHPSKEIVILEKEPEVAQHASGRNSGVLHAGFYYSSDSLKAKFCLDGNKALTEYCLKYNLPIDICGKVVVAKDDSDLHTLENLLLRGKNNGTEISKINEQELSEIEPMATTHKEALYVPSTASIDPNIVCRHIQSQLIDRNVKFLFNCKYVGHNSHNSIQTNIGNIEYDRMWNCAGLYADKIAHDFDLGMNYVILPFKGLYLMSEDKDISLKKHIYPVPNLANPFLGVHFTKTISGKIKIGPTATPAFWRENYTLWQSFNLLEAAQIFGLEAKLLATNRFGFRDLAIEEIRKFNKNYIKKQASYMAQKLDLSSFKQWSKPGIRAQLFNKKTLELEQDFIVESNAQSIHILNAVSPAFTCSMPFAKWLVQEFD